jgi:hypothetical protein
MTLIPGSTSLYDSNFPAGLSDHSNNINRSGIIIGAFGPGGGAYVVFNLEISSRKALICGMNYLPVVGQVQTSDAGDTYRNATVVALEKNC